jgi:hypothetical protein
MEGTMGAYRGSLVFVIILFMLALSACDLPGGGEPPNSIATSIAATIFYMQTVTPTVPPVVVVMPSPVPTNTTIPSFTPTPENPLVTKDALCWIGPGDTYEVVSALKTGTRLELLGRGNTAGWWVVRDPIYHSPCWISDNFIQIDPNTNISGLQIFYAPPSPTSSPFPTPTS